MIQFFCGWKGAYRMYTGRLIEQNWEYWQRCYQHPFLQKMIQGDISTDVWQYYIQENIAYLYGLVEVFAKFLPYCKQEKERSYCCKMIHSITQEGDATHQWLHQHGVVPDHMHVHPATQAYLTFYHEMVASKDFKKLLCAVMPCTLSYAWIAKQLLQQKHDYQAHLWLQEFQQDSYLAFCQLSRDLLNEYMKHCTDKERNILADIFSQGCIHEEAFWDVSYSIYERKETLMFETYIDKVATKTPLLHCITNDVTVNDCANMRLAAKGSPIMADDEREVEDICALCDALLINIGTLNERTITAMIKAGKKTNALHHPVLLDPVGAGASNLRTETVYRLLQEVHFDVIRGNMSEMKTIYEGSGTTKGVDADAQDAITEENISDCVAFAQKLATTYHAVIIITGAIDIVCDHTSAYIIRNGHCAMSYVTGTGCMLSALCGVYMAANKTHILEACACAVAMMGYAGELGALKMEQIQSGTSSLRTYIIDAIYRMDAKQMKEGGKLVRLES